MEHQTSQESQPPAEESDGEAPLRAPIPCQNADPEAFPLLTDTVSEHSTPLFIENLRRGAKPSAAWMCGLEFELFGYDARNHLARLSPAQVQRVLAGFAPSSDDLVYEGRVLIEVNAGQMNRLTVEPGGQIEFSGAPQRRIADIEHEVCRYLARLKEIARAEGLTFLAAGFDPVRSLAEQQWFPKARYEVMRPFLAGRGARGWDMMTRTCAVQANLDYGPPDDLVKKFLVGNRLAPIATAIFANSPFEEGTLTGYKSTRAAVWLETDADRCAIPAFACQDTLPPESFVAYALEVPMIFVQREGRYLDAPSGIRFREFLAGACGPEIQPLFGDWADHLTTLFTDARLKQHLELRSADCGALAHTLAVQAFWKGLLYDPDALDEALRLAPLLPYDMALELRRQVAREGLAARCAGVNVLALAKETIRLAASGLSRIAPDETGYLDILQSQVIDEELCPADILIRNYEGSWHQSMAQVVKYLSLT